MKRHSKTRSYALLTSCSLAALALAAVPVSVDFSLEDGVVIASQQAYARGGGERGGGRGGEGGERGSRGGDGGEHGGRRSEAGEHGRSGEAGERGRREAGGQGEAGERGNFSLFPRSGDDDGTPDQGPGDN